MSKANLNSRTKRMRELAKKDKRAVKDEKRAQKKADSRAARGVVEEKPAPTQSNVLSLAAAAFIRRMNKTP